ncbi:MAG: U32 family peptidase, partial [Victivallales bacterium]|nr:U32 family peptidase [Victivallales bacterium]
MELLAPVNADTLQAALDAGADAVYFGLTRLNARRGAKNFVPDELAAVVQRIHAANAKAHLTLNIDLATRELGLAARTLQLASEAGVDAVIVRDPAILALIPQFPQLQFHLSTQSGISSSAGVRTAKELGCHRVVLAREMTREEIHAASAVPGIETEVFVQGAMCFCCSGRCLLSSWVGGRSGNRGTCASPCRVAWKTADTIAHPMSMHDLCLLERLGELREMGVASLKIEGRLKSASWVHRAVSLYRKALDGTENLDDLREEAIALGNYTG